MPATASGSGMRVSGQTTAAAARDSASVNGDADTVGVPSAADTDCVSAAPSVIRGLEHIVPAFLRDAEFREHAHSIAAVDNHRDDALPD